jgi:hypothetical protein
MKKPKLARDTSLSHAVRVQVRLHTYGEALDFIERLPPKQRARPHWEEIRAYLLGEKPSTKAHLTRLIERAANADEAS